MEEKETICQTPKIEETCKKCVFGQAISPYGSSCAKFKNKPNEIYWDGAECPQFKTVEDYSNEQKSFQK